MLCIIVKYRQAFDNFHAIAFDLISSICNVNILGIVIPYFLDKSLVTTALG